jgi:hypothetical protein
MKSVPSFATLYRKDETAWLETMSQLLAQRRFRELDYRHLSEYLADMAKRDKREVMSREVPQGVHKPGAAVAASGRVSA